MAGIPFASLGYFEKLKAAGVPEEQAKVQADAMRVQAETQTAAVQKALDKYDEASRKDLATKGDIQDVRKEIQDVRKEIQDVRNEVQDVRLEMKAMEMRLLKWQIGLSAAIIAIMAKGFGWLGF